MSEAKERAKAAARALADAVNEVGFDVGAFAEELCHRQHRTLQQNAFRVMARCIQAWAADCEAGHYDLRNEHTVKASRLINDRYPEELKYVPCI